MSDLDSCSHTESKDAEELGAVSQYPALAVDQQCAFFVLLHVNMYRSDTCSRFNAELI